MPILANQASIARAIIIKGIVGGKSAKAIVSVCCAKTYKCSYYRRE